MAYSVTKKNNGEVISLSEVKNLGELAVKSKFFKNNTDVSQAVIKMVAGRELGFGSVASLMGVYIVEDKISFSANLIAAAIKRSERYDYKVKKIDNTTCELLFREKIDGVWVDLGISSFTKEDAKSAGLAGKKNWVSFFRNMAFARALSNGARWYTPDVFAGTTVYTPEELNPDLDIDPESGEVKGCKSALPEVLDAEILPSSALTPADSLRLLIQEVGAEEVNILRHYKVDSLEQLTPEAVKSVVSVLETRRAALQTTAN